MNKRNLGLVGVAPRIVGGYEALPGQFPWLANKNRECGATLIHKVLKFFRFSKENDDIKFLRFILVQF